MEDWIYRTDLMVEAITAWLGQLVGVPWMVEAIKMGGAAVVCAISATVFLGGWMPFHVGGLEPLNRFFDLIPPDGWFFGKVAALIFLVMWFRWTFPRLRVDQLMRFEWKYLMPLALANLVAGAVLYFFR